MASVCSRFKNWMMHLALTLGSAKSDLTEDKGVPLSSDQNAFVSDAVDTSTPTRYVNGPLLGIGGPAPPGDE
jgi:hypothetical protein